MINQTQVSWDSQVIAFKWHQNIGDALSHFAHFSSFLSETQRDEALAIITWFNPERELEILKENVLIAEIKADRPTLTKIY